MVYRIDHKSGGHRVVFCHRAKLLASFLGKWRIERGKKGRIEIYGEGCMLRMKLEEIGSTYGPHNPPGSPML
jgi:hypothetical protein